MADTKGGFDTAQEALARDGVWLDWPPLAYFATYALPAKSRDYGLPYDAPKPAGTVTSFSATSRNRRPGRRSWCRPVSLADLDNLPPSDGICADREGLGGGVGAVSIDCRGSRQRTQHGSWQMSERTFWGIHAGRRGEANSLFLQGNCVALGWDVMGDLSKIKGARPFGRRRKSSIRTGNRVGMRLLPARSTVSCMR